MKRKTKSLLSKVIAGVSILAVMLTSAGQGLATVSAQAAEKEIVNQSTEWKYRDNDVDPVTEISEDATVRAMLGAYANNPNITAEETYSMLYQFNMHTMWTYPSSYDPYGSGMNMGYNDSAWKSAAGAFGFKLSSSGVIGANYPINTTLTANKGDADPSQNPASSSTGTRIPTYFFRYSFNLSAEEAAAYDGAVYELVYDDSAIVYLNGTIIGEHTVSAASLSNNMEYAGTSKGDPETIEETVNAGIKELLIEGENVIAVQLHNDRASSSDVYMNMKSFTLTPGEVLEDTLNSVTVSPGADETGFNFAWQSTDNSTPVVELSDGTNTLIFEGDMPALAQSGLYASKVSATGLNPNTTYTYRVGNGELWSDAQKISTGSGSAFSFLLVGDPQIGSTNITTDSQGWANTVNTMTNAFGLDFILSAGDQVQTYAGNEAEYAGLLNVESLLNVPLATTPGNHDTQINYLEHFNPVNLDNSIGNSANGGDYWFRYGSALFMVINSNVTTGQAHEQFLKDAMAANKDADWNIVVFHHSIYSAANHSSSTAILNWRDQIRPILDDLEIDIVLAGHDHSYVRTYQMLDGNAVDPADVNKLADGTAVDPEGTLYVTANSSSGSKYYNIQQQYTYSALQRQEKTPSATVIDMTANTFTMTSYEIVNDAIVEFDSYSIVKTGVYDTSALEELVAEAEAYDLAKYYVSSTVGFEEALTNAKAVLANPLSTASDINQAAEALSAVIGTLRLIPQTDELESLIKDAEKIKAAEYTKESYKVLEDALKAAKELLEGEPLQKEVEEVYNALQAAIKALVKANDTTGNGGTSGTTGGNTGNTGNTGSKTKSPSTGDNMILAGILLVGVVGAGVFLFVKNRKYA